MRYPWRTSWTLALTLFALVSMVPRTVWPKGERSMDMTRSEYGVTRGVVKAAKQAVLYAQIQARVKDVPFKEGQRFSKGTTLVQLDCDKYRAELAAAVAEQDAKDRIFQNNKDLAKLNAVSALELDISEAEAKKARATVRIADLNVRSCRITAPFSGRVVGVMVNEHENVFPNDKLLSLLDDTSLEIELVLPSWSLSWLKRKSPFIFTVDETRQPYEARVQEIGANVDPASQTIKVTGRFERLPGDVLAGMSGTAQFVDALLDR